MPNLVLGVDFCCPRRMVIYREPWSYSSEVFDLKPTSAQSRHGGRIRGMATIPELLDGHVTLEVECLDCLYLNGYIGKLATGLGLVMFMREQLAKPVPSPVVLGQISEKFREAVKALGTGADSDLPVSA